MQTDIYSAIVAERQRQFDLPGTESDVTKGPNDWITTIMNCLSEGTSRSGSPPTADDFERAMVKSAAVIVAALEHVELMRSKNKVI